MLASLTWVTHLLLTTLAVIHCIEGVTNEIEGVEIKEISKTVSTSETLCWLSATQVPVEVFQIFVGWKCYEKIYQGDQKLNVIVCTTKSLKGSSFQVPCFKAPEHNGTFSFDLQEENSLALIAASHNSSLKEILDCYFDSVAACNLRNADAPYELNRESEPECTANVENRNRFYIAFLSLSLILGIPASVILVYCCWKKSQSHVLQYHRMSMITATLRSFFTLLLVTEVLTPTGSSPIADNGPGCKALAYFETLFFNMFVNFWVTTTVYLHRHAKGGFEQEPDNTKSNYSIAGVAFAFSILWAVLAATTHDVDCWLGGEGKWMQWVRVGVLVILILLLCNVTRLLLTTLKAIHDDTARRMRRVTLTTMALNMIFIVQFSLNTVDPGYSSCNDPFFYAMYFFDGIQAALVAFMFCFFDPDVIAELRALHRAKSSPQPPLSLPSGNNERSITTIDSLIDRPPRVMVDNSQRDVKYSSVVHTEQLQKTLGLMNRLNVRPQQSVSVVEGEMYLDCDSPYPERKISLISQYYDVESLGTPVLGHNLAVSQQSLNVFHEVQQPSYHIDRNSKDIPPTFPKKTPIHITISSESDQSAKSVVIPAQPEYSTAIHDAQPTNQIMLKQFKETDAQDLRKPLVGRESKDVGTSSEEDENILSQAKLNKQSISNNEKNEGVSELPKEIILKTESEESTVQDDWDDKNSAKENGNGSGTEIEVESVIEEVKLWNEGNNEDSNIEWNVADQIRELNKTNINKKRSSIELDVAEQPQELNTSVNKERSSIELDIAEQSNPLIKEESFSKQSDVPKEIEQLNNENKNETLLELNVDKQIQQLKNAGEEESVEALDVFQQIQQLKSAGEEKSVEEFDVVKQIQQLKNAGEEESIEELDVLRQIQQLKNSNEQKPAKEIDVVKQFQNLDTNTIKQQPKEEIKDFPLPVENGQGNFDENSKSETADELVKFLVDRITTRENLQETSEDDAPFKAELTKRKESFTSSSSTEEEDSVIEVKKCVPVVVDDKEEVPEIRQVVLPTIYNDLLVIRPKRPQSYDNKKTAYSDMWSRHRDRIMADKKKSSGAWPQLPNLERRDGTRGEDLSKIEKAEATEDHVTTDEDGLSSSGEEDNQTEKEPQAKVVVTDPSQDWEPQRVHY